MKVLQRSHETTDTISIRVNHLRFINGWSQKVLALRMGQPASSLSQKMNGSIRWNVDELETLSAIFQVSADYLLGRESIESATPLNVKVPASEETGTSVVAGTGFEHVTSGL